MDACDKSSLPCRAVLEGKIPCNHHWDSKDRDEGTKLVDKRDPGRHDTVRAVGDRDDQPHPDEHIGAARSALADQAGQEEEDSEQNQTDGNDDRDVHANTLSPAWRASSAPSATMCRGPHITFW